MSLLLDTHVVLWWLADDPELPDEIKDRLDHEPDVRVSAATIWEIAIKQAIGKITAPADLPEHVRDSGFPGVADRLHPCHGGRAPANDPPRPGRPHAGGAGPLRKPDPCHQRSSLPAIRRDHPAGLTYPPARLPGSSLACEVSGVAGVRLNRAQG